MSAGRWNDRPPGWQRVQQNRRRCTEDDERQPGNVQDCTQKQKAREKTENERETMRSTDSEFISVLQEIQSAQALTRTSHLATPQTKPSIVRTTSTPKRPNSSLSVPIHCRRNLEPDSSVLSRCAGPTTSLQSTPCSDSSQTTYSMI